MPPRQEVLRSVAGAWALARFDVRGMAYFNLTLEGFWRSFFSMVLAAPIEVYVTLVNYPQADVGPRWVFFVAALRYIAGWLAFPLAMIPLARVFGLSRAYVPYIIAYNWAQVVQSLVFLPITMLHAIGVLSDEIAQALDLAALVYMLLYMVFITRTALSISTMAAIGLVVIGMVVSFFVFLEGGRLL